MILEGREPPALSLLLSARYLEGRSHTFDEISAAVECLYRHVIALARLQGSGREHAVEFVDCRIQVVRRSVDAAQAHRLVEAEGLAPAGRDERVRERLRAVVL